MLSRRSVFGPGIVDTAMATEQPRRWCLFTSAGDHNSIRLWLDAKEPRRWDLVIAYYGDSDREFAALAKSASHAFREKGAKFQNLKKLVAREPGFFDRYSHVFVCDDDIQMSSAQIDEAFAITETHGFWVAQPAFRPEGKYSYWINCCAAPQWDYRIVSYVEVTAPIFRRDKLMEFLAVYDGVLVGWGVDFWYANFFQANEFGRFAVIDKVAVINTRDEDKGAREIDRLQSTPERRAAWEAVRLRLGLVEYPHRVLSYGKIARAETGTPRPAMNSRRKCRAFSPGSKRTSRRAGAMRSRIWAASTKGAVAGRGLSGARTGDHPASTA